ncbi:hypothetical protein B0P06_004874 [Clostridium saccharoperbutylacetonicum]|uniref:Uncharacterized protein n=1 Tax=Clostridium saccharoperbutylacetonicum N1-4(HMT) TaxID=931276 RepID=M1MQ38_9CLOT|nr:hypothetical protein [Clostridium saccharoperbutylacetonicum]AGF56846.1 hypothetical protein Cspa_c30850 [Clostridium saccharoperbutylacetonicum N1-4(HMT)]NRT62397.1 hypothetical protein [Clostridium saccharoperbutylacetonicum]NSB25737.1 hypothetical protein [Clostridium saccharoperbutylacetonicum]NSB45103.1 hypothetical protein [Clostridium saccharoperbutylacetonicum]
MNLRQAERFLDPYLQFLQLKMRFQFYMVQVRVDFIINMFVGGAGNQHKRKVYIEERLKEQFLKLSKYTCVIYCKDFRNIGKLINFYGYLLKLKIKYIAVTVKQNRYMSLFSENQLFEMAKENIIGGLSKLDYEAPWEINSNNEEIITFEKDADIYAGDMPIKSSKHINPPAFIPLDFDNYEKFILHYIDIIKGK